MSALRIRTVTRLTGVREGTLRAWERRHGFPRPRRGQNNYRTYSSEDVEAVRQVARLVAEGRSISEAIEEVRPSARTQDTPGLKIRLQPVATERSDLPLRDGLIERFWVAAHRLDTVGMERVLSDAQEVMSPTQLCDDLLLLLLRSMTEVLDVACEHVGSALVRHRLRSVVQAMGSPTPESPRVLLACPTGERHEGGVLALSVHLRQQGWNPLVLGPDLSAEAILEAAQRVQPSLIALSWVRRPPEREMETYLRQLVSGTSVPVVVGGEGTHGLEAVISRVGAQRATSAQALLQMSKPLSRGSTPSPSR